MIRFTAPPGGVLTREVGAITGELELWLDEGGRVRIRYAGAADTYTVAGTPPRRWSIRSITDHVSADPGVDSGGNPVPARLPKR